MHRQANIR